MDTVDRVGANCVATQAELSTGGSVDEQAVRRAFYELLRGCNDRADAIIRLRILADAIAGKFVSPAAVVFLHTRADVNRTQLFQWLRSRGITKVHHLLGVCMRDFYDEPDNQNAGSGDINECSLAAIWSGAFSAIYDYSLIKLAYPGKYPVNKSSIPPEFLRFRPIMLLPAARALHWDRICQIETIGELALIYRDNQSQFMARFITAIHYTHKKEYQRRRPGYVRKSNDSLDIALDKVELVPENELQQKLACFHAELIQEMKNTGLLKM